MPLRGSFQELKLRSKPPPQSQTWLFIPLSCERVLLQQLPGPLAGPVGSSSTGSITLPQKAAGSGNVGKSFPFGRSAKIEGSGNISATWAWLRVCCLLPGFDPDFAELARSYALSAPSLLTPFIFWRMLLCSWLCAVQVVVAGQKNWCVVVKVIKNPKMRISIKKQHCNFFSPISPCTFCLIESWTDDVLSYNTISLHNQPSVKHTWLWKGPFLCVRSYSKSSGTKDKYNSSSLNGIDHPVFYHSRSDSVCLRLNGWRWSRVAFVLWFHYFLWVGSVLGLMCKPFWWINVFCTLSVLYRGYNWVEVIQLCTTELEHIHRTRLQETENRVEEHYLLRALQQGNRFCCSSSVLCFRFVFKFRGIQYETV